MLNPNDIFTQIGFVVDSPHKSSRSKSREKIEYMEQSFQSRAQNKYITIEQQLQQTQYVTSLEIQLGQDDNHLLQIKSYDDPYQIAYKFCQQHQLNLLAVEVVQKKIIEAKLRQEQKLRQEIEEQILREQLQEKEFIYSRKNSNPNQLLHHNNCNQDFIKATPYRKAQKQQNLKTDHQNLKASQSKSITPSKQTNNQLVQKSRTKKSQLIKQKSVPKPSKINAQKSQIVDNACQNLYTRGMLQTKALQQKRMKRREQIQRKQQQQMSFKPQINHVSQKIIQFRKQTGTIPPRNPNKIKTQVAEQYYKQMQQCTFTPEINPISKIIVHNREAYRTENQHFQQFFNNSQNVQEDTGMFYRKRPSSSINDTQAICNKKSRQYLMKQKELQEKDLFKPKLNPKSLEQIKEPFHSRLSRAIQMKQKIKQGQYKNDEYTFQPQVGRSPYYQPSRGQYNKQNTPVWEQLYKEGQVRAKEKQKLEESKSRNQLTTASSQSELEELSHNESKQSLGHSIKASTNLLYENLIHKRVNTIFELLDSDGDGVVSPNRIGIESLSKNVLIFLKPVFEEMDQLNAELNYSEFRKAVINLLNDSDPYKKGLFLSDKLKKNVNQFTFTPTINPKSKQMAEGRNNTQIHQELYEQGVKNQKRKEFMLEKERAKKEEKELQECSFKPCLHLGRKDYHPSILDRKLSDIQFSVNQSSNPNLQESIFDRENYNDEDQY